MSAFDEYFDALAALGIATATIRYSGSGDEGYVEGCEWEFTDEVQKTFDALPGGTNVQFSLPDGLEHDLEETAFDVVGNSYSGWEINEGSTGYVALDVAARTATIHHFNYVITEEAEEPVVV